MYLCFFMTGVGEAGEGKRREALEVLGAPIAVRRRTNRCSLGPCFRARPLSHFLSYKSHGKLASIWRCRGPKLLKRGWIGCNYFCSQEGWLASGMCGLCQSSSPASLRLDTPHEKVTTPPHPSPHGPLEPTDMRQCDLTMVRNLPCQKACE